MVAAVSPVRFTVPAERTGAVVSVLPAVIVTSLAPLIHLVALAAEPSARVSEPPVLYIAPYPTLAVSTKCPEVMTTVPPVLRVEYWAV